MVSAVLSGLVRVRLTLAYAVILICVTTTLSALGPTAADRVFRHASTNLHNLNHGHVGTLLGSAFVVDAGAAYVWMPGLICLMGVAELLWRSGRLLVAFAVGHIGATLLVALGLTAAVEWGWLPVSVTRAEDVGMSYGATAVLGTLTAAVPRRWRPTWIGWWLAVGVAVVWVGRDFTDVGHALALALGMLVATQFGRPGPWTPVRVVLLAVGAAFGFLILASTGPSMLVATVLGVSGALLGAMLGSTEPALVVKTLHFWH
jgi:type III secretory pathway component EscS